MKKLLICAGAVAVSVTAAMGVRAGVRAIVNRKSTDEE
jgi:hypothetical protein